jgi:hypothetical protein
LEWLLEWRRRSLDSSLGDPRVLGPILQARRSDRMN